MEVEMLRVLETLLSPMSSPKSTRELKVRVAQASLAMVVAAVDLLLTRMLLFLLTQTLMRLYTTPRISGWLSSTHHGVDIAKL